MNAHSHEADIRQLDLPSTKKLEILAVELNLQAEQPPGGDERIAAFSEAMLHELQDEEMRVFVYGLFQQRPDIKPSYAANLLLRGFQKHLLREAETYQYPKSFTEPEKWQNAISDILGDQKKAAELIHDVYYRNVQSNIAERYKSFKLIMRALRGRLGDNPIMLDIGCSQNQGLKKLALGMPFGEVEVLKRIPETTDDAETDPALTRMVNEELARPFTIGHSLGVDTEPMFDPEVREWAKSCSFYPSELMNEELVREYDAITRREEILKVGFMNINFVEDAVYHSLDRNLDAVADAVTISTMLYQLSDTERRRMSEMAKRLVKPGGLVIYQEFGRVDHTDPARLEIYPHWFLQKFSYTTAVLDTAAPGEALHPIFHWENGRCQRLVMGLGKLCVDGELKTYQEIIKDSAGDDC